MCFKFRKSRKSQDIYTDRLFSGLHKDCHRLHTSISLNLTKMLTLG